MLMQQTLAYVLMSLIAVLVAASVATSIIKSKRAALASSVALLSIIAVLSSYLMVASADVTVLGLIHIYPFSEFFISLFSVLMALISVISYSSQDGYNNLLVLLSFSFAGISVIPAATNILAIFIGVELIAVATSFMVLLSGRRHIESATKLFLLSTVSIAVFAFAIALLFPYDMSLSISTIAEVGVSGRNTVLFAMLFLVAAMAFDTALFPFNLWVPDVYEGAPSNMSALLAGINKKVSFVVLLEIAFVMFPLYRHVLTPALVGLSITTMFFGNIVAMVQTNVKRMFAYSSISQAGYILIGIAALSLSGLEASIFQMVAHAFMIVGAFAIVLWLELHNIKTLDDYTGLSSRSPFVAVSLTLIMLSMAGIPALIGFYGKFMLFTSAVTSNLLLLASLGVINSFISIYYYYRVLSAMYARHEHSKLPPNAAIIAVICVCVAVVVVFGVFPQPLMSASSLAASSLYKP